MSRTFNKVFLIGHVGMPPLIHELAKGGIVANLSIATDSSYRDKNTQQIIKKTEWHRCIAYNKLAEIIQKYLTKGSYVHIEGSLHTRKYTDKQGIEKTSTEITISHLAMLDRKSTNTEIEDVSQPEQNANRNTDEFFEDIPF